MSAIESCRTAALGGHVVRCEDCSHTQIAYNSCRRPRGRHEAAKGGCHEQAFPRCGREVDGKRRVRHNGQNPWGRAGTKHETGDR
jgi:Transposase zinc-binding domain